MAARTTTQMSTKGQVVLPKALRERHGWKAGEIFEIEDRPDGVLLRRAKPHAHTRYEDVAGCLGPFARTVSIEEMNQAVLKEAGRRWRRKGFARD